VDRFYKQFIIGLVYLTIFTSIGYGIKRLTVVSPTCFDNIQNGAEEGRDCGAAACGKLCDPEILPLTIEYTKLLGVGVDTYDVVAHVSNPNGIYGSGNLTYDLKFKDAQGADMPNQARRGSLYIMPNQRRYVVLTALKIPGSPSTATLAIKDAHWTRVSLTDAPKVDFVLRRESFIEASANPSFEGILQNNSDFDFTKVEVSVILLDDAGQPVAVNSTQLQTLLSKEERYFKVQWDEPVPPSATRIVDAVTNAFLNENFIKRYGSQEKFQQYY